MTNPVKEIYKFNQEAGLLEQGYSDERECAFPIEEALKGFDLFNFKKEMLKEVNMFREGRIPLNAKEISRSVISAVSDAEHDISDVDRLDKHLDTIVFAFGSIFKLGLNPQQAMKALGVVMKANMQKLHAGKDTHGKQMKPEGFVGPEVELQKILDERKGDVV